MASIEAPTGLPCPQASTVTPEERRLLSDGNIGPRTARTIELDERQQQTLVWMLDADQTAVFKAWWRDTLTYGGAWFSAPSTWPAVEGLVVKVRRFLTAPSFEYQGVGFWRVSVVAEVRGASELPQTDEGAITLWLDTFTGTAETQLEEHAQDVPLNASTWVNGGVLSQMAELDGDGNAVATNPEGSSNSALTEFGVTLAFPFTLEFDVSPLATSSASSVQFSTKTFIDLGSGVTDTVYFGIEVAPDGNGATTSTATVYTGESSADYALPEGVMSTIAIVVEADGITATVNGVAQAKIPGALQPYLVDAFLHVGISYLEGVNSDPSSEVSRVQITGRLA